MITINTNIHGYIMIKTNRTVFNNTQNKINMIMIIIGIIINNH